MLELLYRHLTLQTVIWLIVAFPLFGAAANGLIALATARDERARFRPLVTLLGCGAPMLSFAAASVTFFTLTGFEAGSPSAITGPLFSWVASGALVVDVGLNADQLSLIMSLVVSGVGLLIHVYSVGYMRHDAAYSRYFAFLNLFLFFMLLLVLADNLVLMFVGWEGVGLCSYLLIGFWFEDRDKARAGMKAFVVNRIGDAGFLAGMFLIFGVMSAAGVNPESGFFNFQTMERYGAYFVPVATAVSLLLFAGAVGKSAQIPLYVWLPDAMAGPTPVSALIHAATMVTAGVYMVVRLNFIFALSPFALHAVAVIGASTAIYAAVMGLVVTDLKKILAYSTISQLGTMFLACGVGAFTGAIYHLVAHSFFKALLFLSAGAVINALGGEQDVRNMGGLKRRMPLSAWTFVIAAAALAGLAPTVGFFSKDAILWQAYERGNTVLWAMGFLGVGLTSFYIFRAAGFVFFGQTNVSMERWKRVVEAPVSMAIPMMLLATGTLVGGFLGVPQCLGGVNRMGEWLGQLIPYEISRAPAPGTHTEIILMVITLLWSAHFSILGLLIYSQKRDLPGRMAKKVAPLHRLAVNLFYIDELYEKVIVRPLTWFSSRVLWKAADRVAVDGLAVGGTARAVGFMAVVASAAQNGVLQRYLLYFLVGAVAVIAFMAL
ncbi:MAG TPA: NADH-quinone oxidoreductase subunit L [bacterium]|nr:NADH-quinone oxidoreductase subunit L [bacterium]